MRKFGSANCLVDCFHSAVRHFRVYHLHEIFIHVSVEVVLVGAVRNWKNWLIATLKPPIEVVDVGYVLARTSKSHLNDSARVAKGLQILPSELTHEAGDVGEVQSFDRESQLFDGLPSSVFEFGSGSGQAASANQAGRSDSEGVSLQTDIAGRVVIIDVLVHNSA